MISKLPVPPVIKIVLFLNITIIYLKILDCFNTVFNLDFYNSEYIDLLGICNINAKNFQYRKT